MTKKMNFITLTAVLCCSLPLSVSATSLGDWGEVEYCPKGGRAIGFTLKIEGLQGRGDDTALNGISLECSGGGPITSTVGFSGDWGSNFLCPSESRLISCQLRVEPEQGNVDDTAANNLNCKCSNGDTLHGDGTSWGEWNEWSHDCDNGICALQTRVEKPQGDGDDTALNDVLFICCLTIEDI